MFNYCLKTASLEGLEKEKCIINSLFENQILEGFPVSKENFEFRLKRINEEILLRKGKSVMRAK